ncbi:MAG: TolC family protein, partial [Burkholderiales bacterium]|nr:TolC family protein [Burkholderiales bacterium]
SLTDIELGVRRNTVFDNASGSSAIKRGVEISLKLPVFDWGSMQRDSMNARTLAAANRLEASMRAAGANLRDAYAAYRTSYEISRHYRDAILPLRKRISDENLLRYNGMLIGVFELLADTREQIASVTAAIDAEKQFWLADAGLQAAVTGRPMATMSSFTAGMNAGSATDAAAH